MKKLKDLPNPIAKQIQTRWLCAGLVLFASVILGIAYRDASFLLSSSAIVAVLTVMGIRILDKAGKGEYLAIEGVCKHLEMTGIRKRLKSITISTDSDDGVVLLRLNIRKKRSSFWVGCTVELYLDKKAAIYENEGICMVDRYLAILAA